MSTEPLSVGGINVFDPDVYAGGNPATYGLPLDQYDYLREEHPCYLQRFDDPLLIDQAWVLTRNADITTIDRDPDTWAADLGGVNIWKVIPIEPKHIAAQLDYAEPAMLCMDGEDHRRNRRVMSAAFTPAALKRLERNFRGYAKRVVDDALSYDGPFNFVDVVAHPMPMEALGDVLGLPPQDRPKFFRWVDQFASPFDTRVTSSFEELLAAIQSMLDYALELAELRRREPGDDVMSKIVAAADEDTISEEEMRGNVALLASGAAESTRTSLSHGMHQLMREPEKMAWLRERADDIPPTVAQEIVRIASPFTHMTRVARRDVELHGQRIKAGEKVVMLFAAGNFDPETFASPRSFEPARDPNPHVSFGRGPHSCLGKHVAALEIKILLEELLQRTREILPAGPISYSRDNYSRGVFELPVIMKGA